MGQHEPMTNYTVFLHLERPIVILILLVTIGPFRKRLIKFVKDHIRTVQLLVVRQQFPASAPN